MRKLSESIWSDIQDRSSGEVTRKEDSVNLLDKHQFIDYVKNHYESLYPEEHKITSTSIDLGVPVIYESGYSERVSYYFKQNSIVISHYRTPKSLVKALNDNFLLEDVDNRHIIYNICPKDGGEVNNSFFIEVIDFILDNIDESQRCIRKKINESIWSDIQDRSAGDIVRKEDDITNFDLVDMVKYINSIYYTDKSLGIRHPKVAELCIGWGGFQPMEVNIESRPDVPRGVKFYYNIHKNTFDYFEIDFVLRKSYKDLGIDLENIFDGKFIHKDKTVYLYPKDNNVITNQDVIYIIDKLLSTVEKPLIKKKISESIWSDIQDRSAGETVRKEDDVNNLDMNELYEHIYELYEQINPFPMPLKSLEDTSDKKTQYFSIPIFKTSYKVYRLDAIFKNDKISKLVLMTKDIAIKDFKRALIDNFNVTIRSDTALTIEEKDGTLTNQTCMKLISVIVENAPEPYLKKREN